MHFPLFASLSSFILLTDALNTCGGIGSTFASILGTNQAAQSYCSSKYPTPPATVTVTAPAKTSTSIIVTSTTTTSITTTSITTTSTTTTQPPTTTINVFNKRFAKGAGTTTAKAIIPTANAKVSSYLSSLTAMASASAMAMCYCIESRSTITQTTTPLTLVFTTSVATSTSITTSTYTTTTTAAPEVFRGITCAVPDSNYDDDCPADCYCDARAANSNFGICHNSPVDENNHPVEACQPCAHDTDCPDGHACVSSISYYGGDVCGGQDVCVNYLTPNCVTGHT